MYNGNTFTWEEGRQLAALSGNGNTISYKYNDGGIRTSKTVNGVTTNYHLVGNNVTYETNGTDTIYYTYDSSGQLASMDLNGVEYYYIRNAQGDIIGLFDKTGAQVVAYTYDTWGKLISTTGSLASTVGVKNPYLYRGYRYDTETGLYYLQSRYYSPDWGRFINMDATGGKIGELLSHNVFAYCMNNPVNMSDPDGNWPRWVKWVVAAVVVVVAIAFLPEEVLAAAVVTVVGVAEEIGPMVDEVEPEVEATAERVFWSGGEVAQTAAETYAKCNKGATLEMTKVGKDLIEETKGMDWFKEAKPLWDKASVDFAKGAEGVAHVFQRSLGVSTKAIYGSHEYPELIKNSIKIVYHIIMPDGTINIMP